MSYIERWVHKSLDKQVEALTKPPKEPFLKRVLADTGTYVPNPDAELLKRAKRNGRILLGWNAFVWIGFLALAWSANAPARHALFWHLHEGLHELKWHIENSISDLNSQESPTIRKPALTPRHRRARVERKREDT